MRMLANAAFSSVRALMAVPGLIMAVLAAPVTAAADAVDTTAEVLRVVDGDTIDIRDDVRGRLRIRILGIIPVKSAC